MHELYARKAVITAAQPRGFNPLRPRTKAGPPRRETGSTKKLVGVTNLPLKFPGACELTTFNRHGAGNSMLDAPHVMTGRDRSNARQFISGSFTGTKSTPPT